MTKVDKQMINDLDYEGIKFPVSKKDFFKIENKSNICTNVFCYEDNLVDSVYASDKKIENCINFLLLTDKNKSHYVYIKDFGDLYTIKASVKLKKIFYKYCLQCFSSWRILVEHKEVFLKINGKKTVKLRSGEIKFEN